MVPIYEPSAPEPEAEGSPGKLWLFWQERRFLWSVVWKTFLFSSVIALLLPTHYEAVVKVVPGENSGNAMSLMGRLAGAGNGLGLRPGDS